MGILEIWKAFKIKIQRHLISHPVDLKIDIVMDPWISQTWSSFNVLR